MSEPSRAPLRSSSSSRPPSSRKRAQERLDDAETREWLESLDAVAERLGARAAGALVDKLAARARRHGAPLRPAATTPYVNTIAAEEQPRYPGDLDVERRLRNLTRYNAMAIVVRANREHEGIGGHIATYASCATLFEVAFNHFLRGDDLVYFQGHASPGIYARAYLEGRISEEELVRFRRELGGRGLSSYPHPWLMPRFWPFPTVSMGLSPLMAVYQARFNRYLGHRGLADTSQQRVWCFLGDGECDEPESLAGLSLAAREQLDNLIFVVNCNLQRLDGPVRGNGKIIQELESLFTGAGWNVIKVIWGSEWDPLLARDRDGVLVARMNAAPDGEYQKYVVSSGRYIREHFFGVDPRLEKLVAHLSDDQLEKLNRGGHDPRKVHAAYHRAMHSHGRPTVILAKTIKGYGLGEAGEGRNVTHQQKKLDEDALRAFRDRFDVRVSDEQIAECPFLHPGPESADVRYLKERRKALGGFVPRREARAEPLAAPDPQAFGELLKGSGKRAASTTMAYVRLLSILLRHERVGERIVPIIVDEARTFGMETLFPRHGIYAPFGQHYEPVDKGTLAAYREARDGQILEEGITEAGALASWIAAGTAYANQSLEMVPFFTFYSMFGLQRVGDLVWAAADARAKGFLMGATAGRTTLQGEGLQHQDGHSQLMATSIPTLSAYDPAFAYELAVIVHEGLRRMYERQETAFYYITLYNETYAMPAMPQGAREGILAGMYALADAEGDERVEILASGPLVLEALRAQRLLAERWNVGSRVWSVTSYLALRRDALAVERARRLSPESTRRSYLETTLSGVSGPFVAVSDWVRLVPEQIARFLPGKMVPLGTDGFGRSDTRAALRRHFEIDAEHIAYAALFALDPHGRDLLARAREELGIDPDADDPAAV